MKNENQSPTVILRRKQVEAITGLKRSAIQSRIKDGSFPASINLGSRVAVGWSSAEVSKWVNDRIAQRDKGENDADD